MRVYSIEQQHHALRIASSRELNDTESRALIRGVEAYRDAEKELDQLRADLARVKDQCNRQEHGFARRESELQGDLARVMKDGHAISTENGRLERELNAARAETTRLREQWANWLLRGEWFEKYGQIQFRTTDSTGLPEEVRQLAMQKAQALTSDPEPTT